MMQTACKIAMAAALFGLLLVPNPSWGQAKKEVARRVQDEAHLFNKDAIDQANSIVAKIKAKHHKDLWVETLKDGPDIKKAEAWARERFKNSSVNGIYIVITTHPKVLEVELGNETRDSGLFTTADRDELAKILRRELGKNADDALIKVADYTLDKMNEHARHKAGAAAPAAAPHVMVAQNGGHPVAEGIFASILPWICIGLAVLVVLWVVFAIIRAITGFGGHGGYGGGPGYGGGYGGGPGYGYGGGGGGGFFPSLMGGLFGAAAGMWMYNNVFGGHSSSSFGGGGSYPSAGGAAGSGASNDVSNDPGVDTDATGAGGAWGDDDQPAADKPDGDGAAGGAWGDDNAAGGGDNAGGNDDWGGGGQDAGGGDAGGGGWFGGGGGGDAGGGGDWGGGGGGGDWGGGGGGDFGGGGGGGDW